MLYQDFEDEWRTGDRAKAKEIAVNYVKDKKVFGKYEGLSLEQLVALVDLARQKNDEEERRRIDVYLLAIHPPQQIGGVLNKVMR